MRIANSEWMSYFDLDKKDITHQYFQKEKFMAEAMVADREGRIVLLLPQEQYQKFLAKVRERFGNIYASSVHKAVLEAVEEWLRKK